MRLSWQNFTPPLGDAGMIGTDALGGIVRDPSGDKFDWISKTLPPDSLNVLLRQQILENVPSRTAGLNVNRVTGFLAEYGLPACPTIVLDEAGGAHLQSIASVFYMRIDVKDETSAFYLSPLDLAIVLGASRYCLSNDELYKEGCWVHELFHAANSFQRFQRTDFNSPSYFKRYRNGFGLINSGRGKFWEEAVPDLGRSEYVMRYAEPAWFDRLRAKLSDGSVENEFGLCGFFRDPAWENGLIPIPLKYARFDANGKVVLPKSAYAAFAVEVLAHLNPKIADTLLPARYHVAALRQFTHEINATEPGLYVELSRLGYNAKSFAEGLARVYGIYQERNSKR